MLRAMRRLPLFLAAAPAPLLPPRADGGEATRWERQARNVTITRDDWGIPHIHGHTDADAVFGLIYAQAEDDFNRVETNYLNAMGRLAEAAAARSSGSTSTSSPPSTEIPRRPGPHPETTAHPPSPLGRTGSPSRPRTPQGTTRFCSSIRTPPSSSAPRCRSRATRDSTPTGR